MTRRTTERRKASSRRTDDKGNLHKAAKKMISALEMEARKITSVHRRMKVEPMEPENTVEWRAARLIEKFVEQAIG